MILYNRDINWDIIRPGLYKSNKLIPFVKTVTQNIMYISQRALTGIDLIPRTPDAPVTCRYFTMRICASLSGIGGRKARFFKILFEDDYFSKCSMPETASYPSLFG